jgi:hypothetical protein
MVAQYTTETINKPHSYSTYFRKETINTKSAYSDVEENPGYTGDNSDKNWRFLWKVVEEIIPPCHNCGWLWE